MIWIEKKVLPPELPKDSCMLEGTADDGGVLQAYLVSQGPGAPRGFQVWYTHPLAGVDDSIVRTRWPTLDEVFSALDLLATKGEHYAIIVSCLGADRKEDRSKPMGVLAGQLVPGSPVFQPPTLHH